MASSSAVPADFKACRAFLQRAEELDRDTTNPNSKVVAFYCRQYAMELGIALRDRASDAEGATKFLLGLMDELEGEKQSLGDVSREEGEQIVFQFANEVFARADSEDRARRAGKQTAKTFYAASVFFDAMKQFGERGEEVEEKTRYAKWKATEILKAIKEGREIVPGGPGEPESPPPPSHDDIPAAPEPPSAPAFSAPPPPAFSAPPPPAYETFPVPAPAPAAPPPPAAIPRAYSPPPAAMAPPPPASAFQPPPIANPGKVPTKAQFDDAIEYCKFAIAAMEVKDTALALDRLRGAFSSLS